VNKLTRLNKLTKVLQDNCRSATVAPIEIVDNEVTLQTAPITCVTAKYSSGDAFEVDTENAAARKTLLKNMAEGDEVELSIDFRSFQQIEGKRNSNFLRFKRGSLRKLARSFKGQPFLKDHAPADLDSRAGTVTKSQAAPIDDGMAFDMTANVTAPWAVAAILRGNLDRFSIGWGFGDIDTVHCTLCKCPVFTECSHLPGDKITDDDGNESIVEFEFQEAHGVEVSGVSVPAVAGTGISEVRSQLTAAFAATEIAPSAQGVPMPNKAIAISLGLPADASVSDIEAAVTARDEHAKAVAGQLAELQNQNATLGESAKQLAEANKQRAINDVFADNADKFPLERDPAGNLIEHKAQTQLRETLAHCDVEIVAKTLASLPVVRDLTLQSVPDYERATAVAGRSTAEALNADPKLKNYFSQLGLDGDDLEKHGPQHTGTLLGWQALNASRSTH